MDRKSIGAALAAQSLSIFLKLAVGTAAKLQSPRPLTHSLYLYNLLRKGDSRSFLCEVARPAL